MSPLAAAAAGAGLFSVVTTGRLELVVEELHQTADRRPQWREVFLPFKPGEDPGTGSFPVVVFRLPFLGVQCLFSAC